MNTTPETTPPATSPAPAPAPAPAGQRGKNILKIAVVLLALAGSLYWALNGVKWGDLWSAMARVDPVWLVGVGGCVILAHFVRAYRWRLLMPEGGAVSVLNLFSATIIGYMMNNVVPRSGEVLRPFILSKRQNRPMSGVLATILVERIIDGVILLLIFALVLLTAQNSIDQLMQGYSPSQVLKVVGVPIIALVVIFIVLLKTRLGDSLVALLQRLLPKTIGGKLGAVLNNFRSGVHFGSVGSFSLMLFLSLLIWFLYGLSLYCGFYAFGFQNAYHAGLSETLTLLGVTSVGITIAPTPGGFGVYHAFCKTGLIAIFHMPPERALAFAIVVHGVPYLATMVVGALFAIRESALLTQARKGGG